MSNENETRSEKQSTSPLLRRLGLIAALGPLAIVLGYGLAYLYQVRFCYVFGIPNEFIVINWTTILSVSSTILVVSLILLILAAMWKYQPKIESMGPIRRILIRSILFPLPILLIALPFESFWLEISIPVSFIALFSMLISFLQPLWTQRNVEGYRNKLITKWEREKEDSIKTDELLERRLGGQSGILILAVIVALFAGVFFGGANEARTRKEFLIPSTTEQLVVLRVYGDNLICAPLDRGNKEIEQSFYILEMKGIMLTPENVGPLTVSSN